MTNLEKKKTLIWAESINASWNLRYVQKDVVDDYTWKLDDKVDQLGQKPFEIKQLKSVDDFNDIILADKSDTVHVIMTSPSRCGACNLFKWENGAVSQLKKSYTWSPRIVIHTYDSGRSWKNDARHLFHTSIVSQPVFQWLKVEKSLPQFRYIQKWKTLWSSTKNQTYNEFLENINKLVAVDNVAKAKKQKPKERKTEVRETKSKVLVNTPTIPAPTPETTTPEATAPIPATPETSVETIPKNKIISDPQTHEAMRKKSDNKPQILISFTPAYKAEMEYLYRNYTQRAGKDADIYMVEEDYASNYMGAGAWNLISWYKSKPVWSVPLTDAQSNYTTQAKFQEALQGELIIRYTQPQQQIPQSPDTEPVPEEGEWAWGTANQTSSAQNQNTNTDDTQWPNIEAATHPFFDDDFEEWDNSTWDAAWNWTTNTNWWNQTTW